MLKAKSIQQFIVGVARYYVSSRDGDEAVLRIDYRNNTYAIKSRNKLLGRTFQREVAEIAEDLLRRKHGINFAERVEPGKV
jgi:hypothetical protein